MRLKREMLDCWIENAGIDWPKKVYNKILETYSNEPEQLEDDEYEWTESDLYEQVRKILLPYQR